jgi:tol-pal system protein YbgF
MSRARLIAALAAIPLAAGCVATKQDVEQLRLEMQSSQQATDAAIQRLAARTEALLDSISTQNVRMRGDLANRLVQIERQLVQIQELSGQSQAQLTELRRQINQRAEEARRAAEAAADSAARAPSGGGGASDAGGASESTGNAGAVYDAALGAFRRGSMTTARAGFQEFLRVAPRDRRAADALFHIGETYARDPDNAVQAFERVVEQYPASPRAPTALLRIGRVEAGRGNRTEARARFNQIIRAYPRAPEAEEARTEIARLGRATTN